MREFGELPERVAGSLGNCRNELTGIWEASGMARGDLAVSEEIRNIGVMYDMEKGG